LFPFFFLTILHNTLTWNTFEKFPLIFWAETTTKEPAAGNYFNADGVCQEGTEVSDAEECQEAATELDLAWVTKFEDKNSRVGCFFSKGQMAPGVYYNSHPEAPLEDDIEHHSSICKKDQEPTTESPTMEPITLEPTTMEPTLKPAMDPECEEVCKSDLDKVEEDLKAVESDVSYLTTDVPEVLANTFTTVNNLEKMVQDLKAEVDRLTAIVDDHSARFGCLASYDDEKIAEKN